MIVKLSDVASIKFGHYAKPSNSGTILYLQVKHFNDLGQLINKSDSFLAEGDIKKSNLLQQGDILFAAKGFRFFATVFNQAMGDAVASSIFYILKVNLTLILPDYLVAVINSPENIIHFQSSGAGSSVPSVRKKELEDFEFNLIPLSEQKKVVEIYNLYLKDIEIAENIIKQKQSLFQNLIAKLIK